MNARQLNKLLIAVSVLLFLGVVGAMGALITMPPRSTPLPEPEQFVREVAANPLQMNKPLVPTGSQMRSAFDQVGALFDAVQRPEPPKPPNWDMVTLVQTIELGEAIWQATIWAPASAKPGQPNGSRGQQELRTIMEGETLQLPFANVSTKRRRAKSGGAHATVMVTKIDANSITLDDGDGNTIVKNPQ